MMKKYMLILIGMTNGMFTFAQQDPYLTHFAFNKALFNPAAAGSNGSFCISAVNHKQWLKLPDQTSLFRTESGMPVNTHYAVGVAPVTNGLSFTAPFSLDPNRDYGGIYAATMSDIVAYENNTYFKLGVAGAVPLGNQASLRLGVDFTNQTKRWNTAALRPMMANDPLIPVGGNPADNHWMIGAGAYLKIPALHDLRVGLSMSSINKVQFGYLLPSRGKVYIASARHFYFTASSRWNQVFQNPNFTVEPNLMIRSVTDGKGLVKPQADLQGMVTYLNKFSVGSGLRVHGLGADAAYVMVGFYPFQNRILKNNMLQSLRIGYSYDFTLQALRLNSRNTQELQINYCIRLFKKVSIIDNPREVRPHRQKQEHNVIFSD